MAEPVVQKKGWFALDIDGTLTHGAYTIPEKVVSYLKNRYFEGWNIIIVTGRSYPFAFPSVEGFDFPFILSTQNGSSAHYMPTKTLIFEQFFEKKFLTGLLNEIKSSSLAFMAYGEDEKCYCKNNEKYNGYIDGVISLCREKKVAFDDAGRIEFPSRFPIIKLAGPFEEIMAIRDYLEEKKLSESAVIKDPFAENFYLLLLTSSGVSKGTCIDKIKALHGGGLVIAAGNDNNDLSMFKTADISIAMEGSPEEVLQRADIIAPPCENHGIIQGLDTAISLSFNYKNRQKKIWK